MDDGREYGRAEEKAFRLLTLRSHSERELRAKLGKGGFPETVVGKVVARCHDLRYLNDEIFARQRARLLAVNRLAGDRRIVMDLRERGIDADLAAKAIVDVRRDMGQEEAATRLLRKKMRGRTIASLNEREKAGLARSLTGKGFPIGLILKILKKTEEEGFHGDDGE